MRILFQYVASVLWYFSILHFLITKQVRCNKNNHIQQLNKQILTHVQMGK